LALLPGFRRDFARCCVCVFYTAYPYLAADWQSSIKDRFYDEKSAEVILRVEWNYILQ